MEYLEGNDLFEEILATSRLTESKAASIFKQIVDAVDYLHKNFIIHRDLKPENILLNKTKDIAKISDFGYAATYKLESYLSDFVGSPFYVSPEIILAKKYFGPEIDVWSLGVLLYTMTTGTLPWEGQNLKEVMKNIAIGNLVVPDFLSSDCLDLIKRILTVDPRKRATITEIIIHPWLNDGLRIPQCYSKRKKNGIS